MGASNYPGLALPKPPPRARVRKKKVHERKITRRTVYDQVDDRDGLRCQLTARRGNVFSVEPLERIHHHHIEQRGRDRGPDTTANLVSVIRAVHDLLHENRITVTGNANTHLTWTLKADAVVELWGRARTPFISPSKFAAERTIRIVPDEEWESYIRGEARWTRPR